MNYLPERTEMVRCTNYRCEYNERGHDGSCEGDIDGEPAIATCERYVPEHFVPSEHEV